MGQRSIRSGTRRKTSRLSAPAFEVMAGTCEGAPWGQSDRFTEVDDTVASPARGPDAAELWAGTRRTRLPPWTDLSRLGRARVMGALWEPTPTFTPLARKNPCGTGVLQAVPTGFEPVSPP